MKLGELRGAIRKTKGNPFVRVTLGVGIPPLNLVLQKAPLFDALDVAFPDGKAQETGLTFDEGNGMLSAEGGDATAVFRAGDHEVTLQHSDGSTSTIVAADSITIDGGSDDDLLGEDPEDDDGLLV